MADLGALFDGYLPIKLPFALADLMAMPGKRGVFLLEGPGGQPVLLSTAADIRSRMRFRLSPEDAGPAEHAQQAVETPKGEPDVAEQPADVGAPGDGLSEASNGGQVLPKVKPKPRGRVDLREIATGLRWKLTTSHFETDWQFLEIARAIYPKTYQELLTFGPAWFVHIDMDEPMPFFTRTREVLASGGRYIGPFAGKASAGRYIELLQDAFDLCRHEPILRQAPRGAACMYAQMGRCRAFCDGRASLDEYAQALNEALLYATGAAAQVRQMLGEQMRQLSAGQQYERAAQVKARLERMKELERAEFANIGPAEGIQYLLVQCGPGPRKAKTFFFDRGTIAPGPLLDYPLKDDQLDGLLSAMAEFCGPQRSVLPADRERIGLLTHYQQVNPQRRGLIVRFTAALTRAELMEMIESTREILHLRAAERRKQKGESP